MEIDRKELKRRSREAMRLTSPRFWIVALIYLLLTMGISHLSLLLPLPGGADASFHAAALFLALFIALYKMVIDFGHILWSLWASRSLNPGIGSLFQGFSVVGKVILMKLLILARLILWSLGISFLVMLPLILMNASPLSIFVYIIILYIALCVLMLRYALSSYLLADSPDDGASAAIRRSIELMKGWKWQLFRLELSFLGWILLETLLLAAALALALWQGGVFHALGAFSFDELPELFGSYSVWRNGISLDLFSFSAKQLDLFSLYASVSESGWTTLLSDVAILPVLLWLIPYRAVARAGFYDARLRLQQNDAAPPPLD